ncbi:MAG: PEP-CTERM sorting domain-containing protein [Phycisphaeraceae bacterium]
MTRPGYCSLFGLLCLALTLAAQPASAVVRTTTDFGPPGGFGFVSDNVLFPGSPYATRAVLEVRVFWDVAVGEGLDAANIDASVTLPIQINTTTNPWPIIPVISMNGQQEGWSGSGTFSYRQTITGQDMSFGPGWTFWTYQALYEGGPPGPIDDIEVLPTSRIEIDYIDNLAGDTDDDGDIDDTDLGTAFSNYSGPIGRNAQKTFLDGDTDGDGDLDDTDLGTIFSVYTGPITVAAVPEPASLALLAAAGFVLVGRRRRG